MTLSMRGRRVLQTVAVALATVLLVVAGSGSAQADPGATSPGDLLTRYKALARQSEQASEAMNGAQVDFRTKRRDATRAQQDLSRASKDVEAYSRQAKTLQGRVDTLIRASYRGARVNRLYAVLTSDSPQALLDQMSALHMLSEQSVKDLKRFKQASSAAFAAKDRAQKAKTDADKALDDSDKARKALGAKQSDLRLKIAKVRSLYESLTGRQLDSLGGRGVKFDISMLPKGSSPALGAVQAALTRVGDPYLWGGTGPNSFDCSGLMLWAYQQVGRSLPRTSGAQETGGKVISRDQLQPGDLIIYYPDASHVAMYVGDGYVVHASTFGVPVKVVTVDSAGPFKTAVRY